MTPRLRIVPRSRGPWLVITGRRRLVVPPELGRRLQAAAGPGRADGGAIDCMTTDGKATDDKAMDGKAMDGVATDGVATEADDGIIEIMAALCEPPDRRWTGRRARTRPALWLRVPLLPAAWVESVAIRLRRLASWPGLLALSATGVVGLVVSLSRAAGLADAAGAASLAPASGVVVAPVALGLFLVTALWHELGHAAALAREGLPPGGIGAGVLFVVPVLFADVSASTLLDRPGRLRVDLAGMAFQIAAAGLLLAAARWLPLPLPTVAVHLAGGAALAAVAWSVVPFVRTDGYWLLCDALGVADLDRPASATRSDRPWLLVGAVLYRLLNTLFLVAMSVLLPWRLGRRMLDWLAAGGHGLSRRHLVALLAGIALTLFVSGVVRQIVRLVHASRVDVATLVGYHHVRRRPANGSRPGVKDGEAS